MPEDTPATKADLQDFRTELLERMEKMQSELLERMEKMRIEAAENTEKAETNLLRAFRNWSRGSEAHQKVSDILVRSYDDRITALEERVGDLERRRN